MREIERAVDKLLNQYGDAEWDDELLLAIYDVVNNESMYSRSASVNGMIIQAINAEIERRLETEEEPR